MPEIVLNPPSAEILDLFAVPGPAQPLPGGAWRAGDLALSPGRDAQTQEWLSPVLARLALGLDERPDRRRRDLRLAMPVPTRNGSWVVDGWAASRFEPGTSTCRELPVIVAAGRLLHAELGVAVPRRPAGLDLRTDRWVRAERVAFDEDAVQQMPEVTPDVRALLADVRQALDAGPQTRELGPGQLVHADLAGNVLLDEAGAPVVIDFSPSWRPVLWAEAVLVLDSVLWFGADPARLGDWAHGKERRAMLPAVIFRALSDARCEVAAYRRVLEVLTE